MENRDPTQGPVAVGRAPLRSIWTFPEEEEFEPYLYSHPSIPLLDYIGIGADPLLDAPLLPEFREATAASQAAVRPPAARSRNGDHRQRNPAGPRAPRAVSDAVPIKAQMDFTDGEIKSVIDPRAAGRLNGQIRARIGAGHTARSIAAYVDQIVPGWGQALLPDLIYRVAFRRAHPSTPMSMYGVDVERREVPMTTPESYKNWIAQSAPGAYVMGAANAVTMGKLADWTPDPELARFAMAEVASDHPLASFTGQVVGEGMATSALGHAGALARLGRFAPGAAEIIYGAGSGAVENKDNPWWGAVTGATGGGLARNAPALAGTGYNRLRGLAEDHYYTKAVLDIPRQIQKWQGHGLDLHTATILAQPYKGMGSHLIPRKRVVGPINRWFKLPEALSNSPFNVLKPMGISTGDMYELHFKVDPAFHGARIAGRSGRGSGWSGKRLGLEKYNQVGRIWHGSPMDLKVGAGAGLLGIGGAYYLMGDDE